MDKHPVDFDEYVKQNKNRLRSIHLKLLQESPLGTRRIRNRQRDPEKQALLIRFDLQRRERMIASGELEQLGQRAWRWNTLSSQTKD